MLHLAKDGVAIGEYSSYWVYFGLIGAQKNVSNCMVIFAAVISHFTFIHHGTNLAPHGTLCRPNNTHYNNRVINQSGLSAMNVLHPEGLLKPLYNGGDKFCLN